MLQYQAMLRILCMSFPEERNRYQECYRAAAQCTSDLEVIDKWTSGRINAGPLRPDAITFKIARDRLSSSVGKLKGAIEAHLPEYLLYNDPDEDDFTLDGSTESFGTDFDPDETMDRFVKGCLMENRVDPTCIQYQYSSANLWSEYAEQYAARESSRVCPYRLSCQSQIPLEYHSRAYKADLDTLQRLYRLPGPEDRQLEVARHKKEMDRKQRKRFVKLSRREFRQAREKQRHDPHPKPRSTSHSADDRRRRRPEQWIPQLSSSKYGSSIPAARPSTPSRRPPTCPNTVSPDSAMRYSRNIHRSALSRTRSSASYASLHSDATKPRRRPDEDGILDSVSDMSSIWGSGYQHSISDNISVSGRDTVLPPTTAASRFSMSSQEEWDNISIEQIISDSETETETGASPESRSSWATFATESESSDSDEETEVPLVGSHVAPEAQRRQFQLYERWGPPSRNYVPSTNRRDNQSFASHSSISLVEVSSFAGR
ncbi:hypothetical protein C8J56DRAFT_910375 [Mycena floridula]|nr:hypothetical protein C8J56DRAFT_910375 [Mycena floridula]